MNCHVTEAPISLAAASSRMRCLSCASTYFLYPGSRPNTICGHGQRWGLGLMPQGCTGVRGSKRLLRRLKRGSAENRPGILESMNPEAQTKGNMR